MTTPPDAPVLARRSGTPGSDPPGPGGSGYADLIARIARGDRGAFEALFREHYEALVRFAEGVLRSRDVAEDVVQDVMLNVWRQRETLQVDESARAYLFRSVRNRALNQLRNERVRRDAIPHLASDPRPSAAVDSELVEEELASAIRDAVAALPPRCREVFELSRGEGLRYSEIAAVLGISIKTVETQMGRALKSLRERLAAFL
jgi:RNA polymerase sigma-70 factor (ECF subfamily)